MRSDHHMEKDEEADITLEVETLKKDIQHHIQSNLGWDINDVNKYACFMGLAYSVRDRLIEKWVKTQRSSQDMLSKQIYYLSLEFLPGRFLKNYLISLGMEETARKALTDLGFDLDDIEEEEWDAGLGNGGLGRLASCYMDSMARLRLPGYGYGIHYNYGIFHQVLVDGYQHEQSDNWMRRGNPWEILRHECFYRIQFGGRSEQYTNIHGKRRYRWVDTENVMAMACDILVPGFEDDFVTNMRLWTATSSRDFDLEYFNQGDYIRAVEAKVISETISKVLYPSDELEKGKELRLKQQHFFVSATLQDILSRFKNQYNDLSQLADYVAIQLNDTHPSIAIPELMRLLMDEFGMDWDASWRICGKTFGYTNHTVLPEALETWPVSLIGRLLPRHLEIIYEINRRFLEAVSRRYPNDSNLISRLSIIQEGDVRKVRMAYLAIVGSHSVNGVAGLHTQILQKGLFEEFDKLFPNRIQNVTNGITPRRWLLQANPGLSRLITSVIGRDWICNLDHLKQLASYAEDSSFRNKWREVKFENKKRLARYILRKTSLGINPDTLFDIHVKRIHEYKRQLLNILHVIALYSRIKEGKAAESAPRTILFAGKSAPAYFMAKLTIKLINSVAEAVNNDPLVNKQLRVVFLPNYCISQAEKVVPAADLSEQISTAGMEASGTGNMKFALNGALTIGTLDGANVEIMEEVGPENIFIFGLKAHEVAALRGKGYNPRKCYEEDAELRKVLDMISSGYFSPQDKGLFQPIISGLLDRGDYYMVLSDFRSYIKTQDAVSQLYRNTDEWVRKSILNTANMGKFSSDRAVLEYAQNIWTLKALPL